MILQLLLLRASANVASILACDIAIFDVDRASLLRELVRECLQLAPGNNDDLGIDVHRNTSTLRMIAVGFMYFFNYDGWFIVIRLLARTICLGAPVCLQNSRPPCPLCLYSGKFACRCVEISISCTCAALQRLLGGYDVYVDSALKSIEVDGSHSGRKCDR